MCHLIAAFKINPPNIKAQSFSGAEKRRCFIFQVPSFLDSSPRRFLEITLKLSTKNRGNRNSFSRFVKYVYLLSCQAF